MRRAAGLLGLLLLIAPLSAYASEQEGCFNTAGRVRFRIGENEIRIAPTKQGEDNQCGLRITRGDKVVFRYFDWGIGLLSGAYDLDGDGHPDLLIEGYSGGAHCCWTYIGLSLNSQVHELFRFENERAIGLKKDSTGHVILATEDGIFDYFETSHARSAMPMIFLSYQSGSLQDVSSDFRHRFDKEIAKARAGVSKEALERFRRGLISDAEEREPVVNSVLTIVLNYLYSGREAEGWKALRNMWPSADEPRVRREILRTRSKGLLARLHASPQIWNVVPE